MLNKEDLTLNELEFFYEISGKFLESLPEKLADEMALYYIMELRNDSNKRTS